MKRMVKALFLLLTLSMLAGCTKSFSIENPVKVTVQSGPKIVEITDEEIIHRLTEDITSKEFRRGKKHNATGWDYWLKWYDASGELIFDASMGSDGMVYRDYDWHCENGTIDTEYYDELLKDSE